MRVLMATTRGVGHLNPLLPFATACLRAGEEVLVACPHGAVAAVVRAGLAPWGFADPPEEQTRPVFDSLGGLSPDEQNVLVVREVFGRIDTGAALPGMLEAFAQWRPDVVLREAFEFSSCLVAEREKVPHVRLGIGLASGQEAMLPQAAPALDTLRADLRLGPDPDGAMMLAAPYVTLTPASLEDPGAPGPPGTQRFRDPETVAGDAPLPDWWPGDERPLVYVTLGSVAPTMGTFPGLYGAVIEALASLPIRLLVTVGEASDPAKLGALPANVHVEPWVAQADVLPHVAAVVCHGGFGSTLGALAAGAPMALFPMFADQPLNAGRVAELGAGVVAASPSELAGAVERVLEEPSYREGARRVSAEIADLPPADDALDVLRRAAGTDEV